MNKLWISIFIVSSAIDVQAQTFDEIFKQKATQKKYLLQQIAALQIYIGYVQKGYKLGRQGIDVISKVKDGDFNLHGDYFKSLSTLNPSIEKFGKIAAIIILQRDILKLRRKGFVHLKNARVASARELNYVNNVFGRLIKDCEETINMLADIVNGKFLQLKDDERISLINVLYNNMQDYYLFAKRFTEEAGLLSASREKEIKDFGTSRAIGGLKN